MGPVVISMVSGVKERCEKLLHVLSPALSLPTSARCSMNPYHVEESRKMRWAPESAVSLSAQQHPFSRE